jgi:hypothetical protein
MEAHVEQFIRSQNIKRYCRLLAETAEEPKRQTIISLLVEERQMQKDAGDPVQTPN